MPLPEGRAGDACIWFITCLFFLIILAGGVFLILYVILPETKETAWFPVAGMVLVAIPWLFWILTCVYHTVIPWLCQPRDLCGSSLPAGRAPAAEVAQLDHSPSRARRVRFNAATVMGSGEGGGEGTSGAAEGDSNVVRNGEGSSLSSHESEVPLAFSMS